MVAVHQRGAQDGEPAFGQTGETAVELLRDRELKDRVAQEFQTLVVGQALTLLVPEGGMRERLLQKLRPGEGVADPLLKIAQAHVPTPDQSGPGRLVEAPLGKGHDVGRMVACRGQNWKAGANILFCLNGYDTVFIINK
jgi:hypothetical protein